MESDGSEAQEMVLTKRRNKKDGSRNSLMVMKVVYSNVDGFISSELEINDYLRTNEPDVMSFVEIKLS